MRRGSNSLPAFDLLRGPHLIRKRAGSQARESPEPDKTSAALEPGPVPGFFVCESNLNLKHLKEHTLYRGSAMVKVNNKSGHTFGCSLGNGFSGSFLNIVPGENTFSQEDWNKIKDLPTVTTNIEDGTFEVAP